MNYITHLNSFFERAENQDWLTPHHQSLYLTLFRIWNQTMFRQTFTIYRDKVMGKAKIGSKTTYYRCLRELENAGYFKYHRPRTKYEAGAITMTIFSCPRNEPIQIPEMNHGSPTSGTADVPQMGHFPKQDTENLLNANSNARSIPTQDEVHQFFREHQYPLFKAVSFWYQHESKNWHSGDSPIRDWQALAHKWMADKNAANPKTNKNASYSDKTDQDYQEPF
ncbi:hypothetical protein [Chitinophaga sp. CF418]|uniref:hypothetical protein n=1 Tax=Chitinophaga sp. CF418 TaxID=1855287 RepID=UPI000921E2CB|nr:hypothetical protein [Chitinophaga sp. CF418]SHN45713.1 hypothetical protein SAMN05216311_12128 [Chitinophaga sp. CF418]